MAKSFFERLTGSMRIREDDRPQTQDEEPQRPKESKLKTALRTGRKAVAAVASPVAATVVSPTQSEDGEDESSAEDAGIYDSTYPKGEQTAQNVGEGAEDEEGQLTLDVYDDGSHFVVQSTLAGVRPEDLDVSLQNDALVIRGMRKRPQEVHDDRFYARELYWGSFSRSVMLPEEVDYEKAEASLKNGLLTLRIPKRSYESTKKIRIRTE